MLLDELVRWLADAEGAGHVRVAAGLGVARKQVDDDGLARLDGPVAWLVADRGLGTVRDDDEIRGNEALLGEDAKRLCAKLLGRHPATLAKPGPDRVQRKLAATLGTSNALELDIALGAAAQVEELSVRVQLDPFARRWSEVPKGNGAGVATSSTPACRQARSTSSRSRSCGPKSA